MRHYFAAVAGLFAAVGFATAQAPAPMPIPVKPAQPMFTPAGNFANPEAASQFQQTSGFIPAAGNCASCSSTAKSRFLGAGVVMPIGCSCLAAENTFLFGSCSQFFHPTNYCAGGFYGGGCNMGGTAGGGCSSCGGGGRERHPCQGVTSYLNR
jgi:hypothetical protein